MIECMALYYLYVRGQYVTVFISRLTARYYLCDIGWSQAIVVSAVEKASWSSLGWSFV